MSNSSSIECNPFDSLSLSKAIPIVQHQSTQLTTSTSPLKFQNQQATMMKMIINNENSLQDSTTIYRPSQLQELPSFDEAKANSFPINFQSPFSPFQNSPQGTPKTRNQQQQPFQYKQLNQSIFSSAQPMNSTTTTTAISNSISTTEFVKRRKESGKPDLVKRFFDEDLNIEFAQNPSKFLGDFKQTNQSSSSSTSSSYQYSVSRKFINTPHSAIKLYHTRFIPSNSTTTPPKAIIIVVHGFCEHSGLYINFADFFVREGFEVHLYDQRGFGYTGGIMRNSSTIEFQQDFTTILSQTSSSSPVFVYAHSTGSLSLLSFLINNPSIPIAGVITLNAFLRIPNYYRLSMAKRVIARIVRFFYEDLLINSKINLSALCKNSYHIKKIISDEHISPHLTLRMAQSLIEMCEYVQEQANSIRFPIYVLHGKSDAVSKCENSIRLFNTVSSEAKQLHLIEDGYHQPHLDSNANELHILIRNWLDSRLSTMKPPIQKTQSDSQSLSTNESSSFSSIQQFSSSSEHSNSCLLKDKIKYGIPSILRRHFVKYLRRFSIILLFFFIATLIKQMKSSRMRIPNI